MMSWIDGGDPQRNRMRRGATRLVRRTGAHENARADERSSDGRAAKQGAKRKCIDRRRQNWRGNNAGYRCSRQKLFHDRILSSSRGL